MSDEPSRALGNRFRLGRALGAGASASVHEATDLLLGREVAIKREHANRLDDQGETGSGLIAEARTLARVTHPHVVALHDCAHDEHGAPYLVLELLPESLRALLSDGALETQAVVEVVLPLCGALAVAHDIGILHADLKPENIGICRQHGRLTSKLLDFGVAHEFGARSAVVLGTPGYIAPERVLGETPLPSSDVWSLGVVAFECILGRSPFGTSSREELLERCVNEDAPRVASLAPHVPLLVARAIDRALERDPERRYGDMRAFARGLIAAAVQSNLPINEDPDPVGLPDARTWRTAHQHGTERLLTHEASAERRVTHPRYRVASSAPWARPIASIALVACALVLWSWLSRQEAPAAATPARVDADEVDADEHDHVRARATMHGSSIVIFAPEGAERSDRAPAEHEQSRWGQALSDGALKGAMLAPAAPTPLANETAAKEPPFLAVQREWEW